MLLSLGPVEDLGAGCGWVDRVSSDPSELDSLIPVVNSLLIHRTVTSGTLDAAC